ncbi:alpha-galactosidase [Desulforhopalus sp. 52FAK]
MSVVRLDSENCTYLLSISDDSLPVVSYWGSRLPENEDTAHLTGAHNAPVFQAGLDKPYQLNIFPETGTGFRGSPALIGEREGEHWAQNFTLVAVDSTPNSAVFSYEDQQAHIALNLEVAIDGPSNVLQRRTCIVNKGVSPYSIHFCAAASLPVPSFCKHVMKFHGCWTGEFMTSTVPFSEGSVQVENRTGRTSHEYFPALLAAESTIEETTGRIYAAHFGWSGNSRSIAEHIPDGSKQLQFGELFLPGEGTIEPGCEYVSPWVYATCSDSGLNTISKNFHTFFRSNIVPQTIRSTDRPVQVNTWEAMYFDHDMDRLKAMASKAAQLGIERFVLDDGWFHDRSDDTQALGDWWPDSKKYPEGLGPLCKHVKELGMQFGLWLEPEMVNEKSQLFTGHPDWILCLDGFNRQRGRNQLVLNLCLPEVIEYLFEKIDTLLETYPIDYVKWDMNRILTEAGSSGAAAVSEQTRSFYGLLDKIRKKHPRLEIESCASGGGRVDYEVLARTERFWASDSNDPFRRLQIQKGASIFFPPEVIGSHAGPELCHTSGRVTEIDFRIVVSIAYHFGFEFDILELSPESEQKVREFISLYKEHRELFHTGTYVRLDDRSNNRTGYGIVNEDRSEAIFFVHQCEIDVQSADRSVVLTGLNENGSYELQFLHPVDPVKITQLSDVLAEKSSGLFSGTFLMDWGISLYLPFPGTSAIIKVTQEN